MDGLIGACDTCWDHMQATIKMAALLRQAAPAVLALDEAASVVRQEEMRVCHRRWPWRKSRR